MRFILVSLLLFGIFLYDVIEIITGGNGLIWVWSIITILLVAGLILGKIRLYKSKAFFTLCMGLCSVSFFFQAQGGIFWLPNLYYHLLYLALFVLVPWIVGQNIDYDWLKINRQKLLLVAFLMFSLNFLLNGDTLNTFRGFSESASGIRLGVAGNVILLMALNRGLGKGFKYVALALGVVMILVSQTRSQFLFSVVLLIMHILRDKQIMVAAALLMFFYKNTLYSFIHQLDLFQRFARLEETGTNPRGDLYIEAYTTIMKHPLGGKILLSDGTYPHNIILEVLMSFGLVGLLFILWMLIRLVNAQYKGFILLAIYSSLFSFSLITNPFLWFALGIRPGNENTLYNTKK